MAMKSWQRLAIALAGMVVFTVLFCLPGSDLPESGFFSTIPFFDKWVHMGIFCTIIILWSWSMQLIGYKQLAILLLLAVAYGLLIEVIQYQFISGRSFDIFDVLADSIGSLAGLLLWCNIYKRMNRI